MTLTIIAAVSLFLVMVFREFFFWLAGCFTVLADWETVEVKEVSWVNPIEKAEFIFKREFMVMEHNYLCAVCKEKPAVMETHIGILQPCWECQSTWKLKKLSWFARVWNS